MKSSQKRTSSFVSGKFEMLVDAAEGTSTVLLGNAAFALGVIHAGFRAAEGYPGTPSTEVIDTLLTVPEKIDAAWSVNEATAVGVGLGRSLAGDDVVVTMKTPGLFQAADVVSSAAFYDIGPGAMVLYVATDYEPSSTQNIIDARYFLSSCAIPILEPRDHQDIYEISSRAARLSRTMRIPVAVVCSGMLAHSEGIVTVGSHEVAPAAHQAAPRKSVLLPAMARTRYDDMTLRMLPAVAENFSSGEATVIPSDSTFGVIAVGATVMPLKEAAASAEQRPRILSLSGVFPLAETTVRDFVSTCPGGVFVLEEGGRFVEERIRLAGIPIVGKEKCPTITHWDPKQILALPLHWGIKAFAPTRPALPLCPVERPPAICPGCPYRSVTLAIQNLKKKKRLDTVFGDIGCSTLMLYLNALDLNLCMGASESIRQGYVRSKPEQSGRTISLIGDSGECHSGLDASRNAVYRNIPGVKVVLDNRSVAMTGGQTTPTTSGKIDLAEALRGEGIETVSIDAYDLSRIEKELEKALLAADNGSFVALVIGGTCLQSVPSASKRCSLTINTDQCTRCGRCAVCPGIAVDEEGLPHFTMLCRNCGGNQNVCVQRCRKGAVIERKARVPAKRNDSTIAAVTEAGSQTAEGAVRLPKSIRLAVRGIGGQGNLFLGRVLANVFLTAVEPGQSIIKGETHGMAQLGGPVISTFGFGDVHSPVFLPGTADVLISMETAEVLRPDFLALLKPGGTLIFNSFSAVPPGMSPADYPCAADIIGALSDYNVMEIDAFAIAAKAGDTSGATANVAVISLLSTIPPFSAISSNIWLNALLSLSKTESAAAQNRRTFLAISGGTGS